MARKRLILLAAVSALAAFTLSLPLSWAASLFVPKELPKLTYQGTIWNGTVSDIPVFGTANFKLHPLSLSADVETGEGKNYLAATASRTEARDVRVVIDLSTLPLTDQRLQNVFGTVTATLSKLGYTPEGCTSAEGNIHTDVLQRNGGTINWVGPELSGPVSCENGALLATVSGQDAEQSVEAMMRFSPDGTYRADITARTSRQEAGALLPLFGFTRVGQDFKLTEQGKWR